MNFSSRARLSAITLALLAVGCGETPGVTTDAGTTVDSGSPVADSGTVIDSGTPAVDAGTTVDAGVVYNDCTENKFVDKRADTTTDVNFGGALGSAYSPACVLIAVGRSVIFKGNFGSHPLVPGTPGNTTAGSPNNPIVARNMGSSDLTTSFTTAGDYPYNCNFHNGSGMKGVVRVR